MKPKTEVIIEIKNLTKKFKYITAVNDLNLEIFKGEILGFLGPNGAGKTTTMKLLAHLLKPNNGEIFIRENGKLQKLSSKNKDYLLDNIGFLIENPEFYKDNTPRQLLTLFAKLKGYPRHKIDERVEEIVHMVGLSQWIDHKMGTFSKGMRQKIGILSALVHDPAILVLDEPQTGLDPKSRKEIRDLLINLKNEGKTIFLSSHLLYEISEIADRIAIISHGILVACDTLENLEMQAKSSQIQMELLDNTNIGDNIKKMNEIIHSYLSEPIRYNHDSKLFEIPFDGTPEKQYIILKILIENGLKIIDFTVSKTDLLERLYLQHISQSDKTYKEFQKKSVIVEKII
ncbi:MAG: ABC transporter ATP-binding protein [Promethearchaeota archaeon]